MTLKVDGNKQNVCKKCKVKIAEHKKAQKEEKKDFEINSLDSSGNVRLDSSRKFTMSEKPSESKASDIISVAEAPQVYEDNLRQYEKDIRTHI